MISNIRVHQWGGVAFMFGNVLFLVNKLNEMTTQRWLALAGIIGGFFWITLGLFPPDWGPPGTRAYEGYQQWNRLWTAALLLMALGFAGLFRALRPVLTGWARVGLVAALIGFAPMMFGNFAEFWIFTTES